MRVFFKDTGEIQRFLAQAHLMRCAHCGACGALRRHGYIRGHLSAGEYGIRAWRIYCHPRHGGCGKAPGIRLSACLLNTCLGSRLLWDFIRALAEARSIKAAWEGLRSGFSLDMAYGLHKRLKRRLAVMRTRLHARGPPPDSDSSDLIQTFAHLRERFGPDDPVAAYQLAFQAGFMDRV